jgi:hypothetical protein
MEKRLSASDIANLLVTTKRWVNNRAKNEQWPYRSYTVRGGKQKRFHLADLPEDIQRAYAASVNMDLPALQAELTPVPKAAAKVTVDGYACRSAGGKTYKTLEQCTEAELAIARNRQKIIGAYERARRDGINAQRFVALYNEGKILPEVKARLGRRGEPKDYRRFYDTRLKPYAPAGLAGPAPQYKKRGGHGGSLSQEVKNLLEYLYLDTNRPGVADTVRHIREVYGHTEVNEGTAYRYLMSIPQAFRDYRRRGAAYFEKHQPYVSRDYTALKPMEVIVGDYMTQDFMLRLGEKVCRAKAAAFTDMRTRAVAGWSLRPAANPTGAATALQKCFDRFGLPETIYFDNGREFKNRFLRGGARRTGASKIDTEDAARNIGVAAEAGVKIIFAAPYNGKAKPVERFDKRMPACAGSNTADSPDDSKIYKKNVGKTRREDFEAIPGFSAAEAMPGNFFERQDAYGRLEFV